ncbi:MAG: hypothetical protein ACK5PZ_10890, partial [Pirellula sp.]
MSDNGLGTPPGQSYGSPNHEVRFAESIHQISRSRYQLPGVMENDAPVTRSTGEAHDVAPGSLTVLEGTPDVDLQDPIATRIEQTLRIYTERVSSWGDEIVPRRLRDH